MQALSLQNSIFIMRLGLAFRAENLDHLQKGVFEKRNFIEHSPRSHNDIQVRDTDSTMLSEKHVDFLETTGHKLRSKTSKNYQK